MKKSGVLLFGAGFLAACCLMAFGVAVVGCAPAREDTPTAEQPEQLDPPDSGGPVGEVLDEARKTSFYVKLDQDDASASYTVVKPGQKVFFRSFSENEITLEVPGDAFVGVGDKIVLPADGTPFEVQVDPNLPNKTVINTRVVTNTTGDHGSPRLIVREPPIGEDGF